MSTSPNTQKNQANPLQKPLGQALAQGTANRAGIRKAILLGEARHITPATKRSTFPRAPVWVGWAVAGCMLGITLLGFGTGTLTLTMRKLDTADIVDPMPPRNNAAPTPPEEPTPSQPASAFSEWEQETSSAPTQSSPPSSTPKAWNAGNDIRIYGSEPPEPPTSAAAPASSENKDWEQEEPSPPDRPGLSPKPPGGIKPPPSPSKPDSSSSEPEPDPGTGGGGTTEPNPGTGENVEWEEFLTSPLYQELRQYLPGSIQPPYPERVTAYSEYFIGKISTQWGMYWYEVSMYDVMPHRRITERNQITPALLAYENGDLTGGTDLAKDFYVELTIRDAKVSVQGSQVSYKQAAMMLQSLRVFDKTYEPKPIPPVDEPNPPAGEPNPFVG